MREPLDHEWYGKGLKFECTQCGNCCTGPSGYVWFSDGEAKAMADYLGLSEDAFRRQYAHTVNGQWTVNEKWNPAVDGFDCVFLRRDQESSKALCGIYPVRPTQCRTWPFWPQNLGSRAEWGRAARNCPGMNRGEIYPIEQIRILRDRTDGM